MPTFRKCAKFVVFSVLWLIVIFVLAYKLGHLPEFRVHFEFVEKEAPKETLVKSTNPCIEQQIQNDNDRRAITSWQNRHAGLLADIALEVEKAQSKNGLVAGWRLAELVRKHDATHRRVYEKIYSDKEIESMKRKGK